MLTETLKKRQQKLQLDNAAFARRLGVSRAMWSSVKADRRAPGVHLLRGVTRAFPDLDAEVLAFLRGGR